MFNKFNNQQNQLTRTFSWVTIIYCLSWAPYATVTMIGQYGNPEHISPALSVISVIMAKTSTVINPIIFGLMHPSIRRAFKEYILNIISAADWHTPIP